MRKGYVSPIWEVAPSYPIVTKCGLCVPFPDVVIYTKFHLYCTNRFWAAGPRKLDVPIDLRDDVYNS